MENALILRVLLNANFVVPLEREREREREI